MSAVLPLVLPLTASVVQGAVLNGLSNPNAGPFHFTQIQLSAWQGQTSLTILGQHMKVP